MKTCIRGAKIFTRDGILERRDLVFDEKIIAVSPEGTGEGEVIEHDGYVSAGFIDLNVHGAGGRDTMEGSPEAFRAMASVLPQSGVTSFLATTMSDTKENIQKVLQASRDFREENFSGANLLGVHLDGPFLNPNYPGTHDTSFFRDADQEWTQEEQKEIKIITLAPERDPEHKFIKKWSKEGIVVSLGHSEVSFEQAEQAWNDGASHIAHLFHAMPPLHHRRPGLLGAALAIPFTVELICDGVHVHPALFDMVEQMKGIERINLISRAAAGLLAPEGEYPLGNQRIEVKDGISKLKNGKLAGTVQLLDSALQMMVEASNLPVNQVLRMLTINPAKRLGIYSQKGSIDEGKDADIVLLDEELQVKAVYVAGRQVFRSEL